MSDLASGLASSANTAPAATESAPAPSAPSAPAASSPTTLADAFAQFQVGEETPADAPTDAPTGEAPTTAEPQPVEPPAGVEAKPGPIPFDVHKTALENARKKATEELQQQYRDAISFATQFEADPVGTFMHLGQQLQNHPELSQRLRSEAGRLLAAQRRAPQQEAASAQVEPEPTPDLIGRDANGQEVAFYSAEQLAKREAWNQRQFEQRFSERFKPLTDLQKQYEQRQAAQKQTAEYVQRNTPLANELREMPGFKEHVSEIQAKQVELLQQSPSADPLQLWFRAYREIVPAKLHAKQQEQLVTTALNKSAGRDSNPASAVASPPPTPKTIQEAFGQLGLR